jgi:UDP-N-acetylglucosamine 2-epimerase (non-hydrolysing)
VKKRIFIIFGTRPEAIKMAPVIREFQRCGDLEVTICTTGQHREMLRQVFETFSLEPTMNLDLMQSGQSLGALSSRIIAGLDETFSASRPDLVLVQGDTTTAFCAALVAFYHCVPVGHVEAGLRTGNMQSPWPEEANRVLVSRIASLHFAPTERAERNLLAEGVDRKSVFRTGNTVIDALFIASAKAAATKPEIPGLPDDLLDGAGPLVLITCHRRESFGEGLRRICAALAELARMFPETSFVFPVHLNPNVRGPVSELLAGVANVHLIEPVTYLPFVRLLAQATIVLTDSGGIQEEAPSFGKPVLVMRDVTERPEAVEAGTARLVSSDPAAIVGNASTLLRDPAARDAMVAACNPFGDGRAAARILAHCREFLALPEKCDGARG